MKGKKQIAKKRGRMPMGVNERKLEDEENEGARGKVVPKDDTKQINCCGEASLSDVWSTPGVENGQKKLWGSAVGKIMPQRGMAITANQRETERE